MDEIHALGGMFSISYTGVTSRRVNTKVVSQADLDRLEVLAEKGSFNFQGNPEGFKLFAEAERIDSAYQFDPLFAVNCSIVDPLPHQVEAVYKFLLPLPRIRFLLADDTGAGKTIMAGLLLKELMIRGFAERILIITPGGLTKQWQEDEMGLKFNIPFTLVNRALFSSDPNVFHSAPRIITSIDFISREDVLKVAGQSSWDLIIFDEAHKLSAYDYGTKLYRSKRYIAAQTLAEQCDHLLLLTATPHRGRTDTFKKLLQLLDEEIFATEELANTRVQELERNGLNKFFIRRLKEDMKDWEGKPLYKNRFTRTVSYQLTPEEKALYDAVTNYLSKRKEEAAESRNIHVHLALTVMQRRLASSIFAIKNTLGKRWQALQSLVDEIGKNPALWNQRHKLDEFDVENPDDYDELGDEEREALDNILSDPRKFKLFTTARSLQELQEEAKEVKRLFEQAVDLYNRNQEEQKFKELRQLLKSEQVIDGEKLVIFTEHKDTLLYLEERLKNNGYGVATIHGGKAVEERRQAQWAFAKPDTQILIATDAAGEGINLQFCRLLINWDIPWNPNRLEQRMGRIHRYGQKKDVLVFNMVAGNTKEGHVLKRLLTKLDVIRESLGDDRVYDVIQDVLEGVSLEDIIQSVLEGKSSGLDEFLEQDEEQLKLQFSEKIDQQRNKLGHSRVDYQDARELKEHSDEQRLQPIYIRLFFEKAFSHLGGVYVEIRPSVIQISQFPKPVADILRNQFNIHTEALQQMKFCFDKQIFLDYQMENNNSGNMHYINPGNPVFDSLLRAVKDRFRDDMLKGTVLVSPDDPEEYFAFFVKSQIVDNRPAKAHDSVTDERLGLVQQTEDGEFSLTSSAKYLDLHPPAEYAKSIEPQAALGTQAVIEWSFNSITIPQYAATKERVDNDTQQRKNYLEEAFTRVVVDLQAQIQELQGKLLLGNPNVEDKIREKHDRIAEMINKKMERLNQLDLMMELSPKKPEILGCAFVIPLSKVEYQSHYGMSRDDEVEAIAMLVAMDHEQEAGWKPEDVSKKNQGYDIRSVSSDGLKRYIEVKGRSGADGSVMLSENEMYRLGQLGDTAWLYIVINCKSEPELYRIQNPAKRLRFERRIKGIQFFLPMEEWKGKVD